MKPLSKRKKDYMILTIIMILIIIGCVLYQGYFTGISFEVTERENCTTDSRVNKELLFIAPNGQKYYTSCLDKIDVHLKNKRTLTMREALEQEELTLNQILKQSKSKEESEDGELIIYRYSDFSIIRCQRTTDTETANHDIIFAPKNATVEATYCDGTSEKEKLSENEVRILAQNAVKTEWQTKITDWEQPEIKIVQFHEEPNIKQKYENVNLVGIDLYQVNFQLQATNELLVVYIDCYDETVYGIDYE